MPSLLYERDAFSDAKHTLSSWDNCMSKAYCKWPVIVVIIIGGLIVLSLLICLFRCLCCGVECCCGCFACCNACCPSPRGKRAKRADTPPPGPYTGYAPPPATAPMPQEPPRQYAAPASMTYEPSTFARFEEPSKQKPVSPDALPPMPSWGDATTHKVEEEVPLDDQKGNDVEMNHLDHNGYQHSSASDPMLANAAAAPMRSPHSPPQRQGSQNDYFAQNVSPVERVSPVQRQQSPYQKQGPYNPNNVYNQDAYGNQNSTFGSDRLGSPAPTPGQATGAAVAYPGYRAYTPVSNPSAPSELGSNDRFGSAAPPLELSSDNGRYNSPPPPSYHTAPPNSQAYQQQRYYNNVSPSVYSQSNFGGSRQPSAAGYAPSGSTRYEPSVANGGYSNGPAPARKAVQGSWKDI